MQSGVVRQIHVELDIYQNSLVNSNVIDIVSISFVSVLSNTNNNFYIYHMPAVDYTWNVG